MITSSYESAASHGLPRNKENEMKEKPLTQAGGCSSRARVVVKTCLAQPSPWNERSGRWELTEHFWGVLAWAGAALDLWCPFLCCSLAGWTQLALALQFHAPATSQGGRNGPTEC